MINMSYCTSFKKYIQREHYGFEESPFARLGKEIDGREVLPQAQHEIQAVGPSAGAGLRTTSG